MEPILSELAENDLHTLVQGDAIEALSAYPGTTYLNLFNARVNDSSYYVAGEALRALATVDSTAAYAAAKRLAAKPEKGLLADAITSYLLQFGTENDVDLISVHFAAQPFRFRYGKSFAAYLGRITDVPKFKKGLDVLVALRDRLPATFQQQINQQLLVLLITKKKSMGQNEQAEYVQRQL